MTKALSTPVKDSKVAPSGSLRKWKLVSQWGKVETDYQQYIRIKESNEAKEKKRSDRVIKKLNKDGKVQPISAFFVCKEEEEDDWTQSKKERFQRNRINCRTVPKPHSTLSGSKSSTATCHELDSDESNEEEDCLDILNFRPFRNALNKPIARRTK